MPTCWKSDKTELSGCLCFRHVTGACQALHFSFSIVFPPDPGWEHPETEPGWSWQRVGQTPEQPLTEGMSQPAAVSPRGVSLTPNVGTAWACLFFQALPVSLPGAEQSLQPVLATLLLGVRSAQHPSCNPQGTAPWTCTDWALWDSVAGKVAYTHSELPFIWINDCCH